MPFSFYRQRNGLGNLRSISHIITVMRRHINSGIKRQAYSRGRGVSLDLEEGGKRTGLFLALRCRKSEQHWDRRAFFTSSSNNTKPGKRECTIKKSNVQKTISNPSSWLNLILCLKAWFVSCFLVRLSHLSLSSVFKNEVWFTSTKNLHHILCLCLWVLKQTVVVLGRCFSR